MRLRIVSSAAVFLAIAEVHSPWVAASLAKFTNRVSTPSVTPNVFMFGLA